MLKGCQKWNSRGRNSEAAPEQKYETRTEKHLIKRCPATLGVSLCLISCILSAWKQTAAALPITRFSGPRVPSGAVMPAWTWHGRPRTSTRRRRLEGQSCSSGRLCLLHSSTWVFKWSCVANEWGHINSTAQSKIGLPPGGLLHLSPHLPLHLWVLAFHPPILSELFTPTLYSSHYHILNLLLYTC